MVWLGAVIGNKSIEWIREKAQAGGPWLAYIAPKACHEPFNPAPWYVDFWDPAWPTHEPRTPNWNTSGADHHGAPGGQHPPLAAVLGVRFQTGGLLCRSQRAADGRRRRGGHRHLQEPLANA